MNRVYIKTYGCQMNERDSDAVAALLRGRGYTIINDEKEADIILLNTCSVRDQAEQKAIGKAGHLLRRKRKNQKLVVGVMGCMAQNRGQDLLDSLPDLDLVVGTQKFHQVPDHLDNIIATLNGQGPKPSPLVDLEEEEDSQNTIRDHNLESRQVSAFVSIMQGCNMNCTYCIVPTTRGRERARPIPHILKEVEELAANGTREVTLLGQIVTSYGRREIPFKDGKSPFVQLLEQVSEIDGIERIRFTSPHPRGFKQDLIEAYGRLPKLCPYVHLPLQSGSQKILKAMKRPYSPERFKQIVDDLRAQVPGVTFSTDIIVGFPGETDEDFEQTRALFEAVAFEMAFIFKYSERPNTEAEGMSEQVSQEVKEQRNQILLDILHKNSLKHNESLIGTIQQVLVEAPARKGEGCFAGRTPGYRKAIFPASERLIGELVPVKIERATTSSVFGSLVLSGVEEPTQELTPLEALAN